MKKGENMKNMNKLFTLLVASSLFALTSCIEETFPENETATAEQIAESSSALEAAVNGIPSQMSQGYYVYGEQTHETDMAFPQFMIAQTELLGDMYPEGSNSGYDWYRNYNTIDRSFGKNSYFAYLPWFTLYKFVKASNDVIGAVDIEGEGVSDQMKALAGAAYACRAFDYFMLMVFWEPASNIYTDCSKVMGLTVPIVTEATTGEDSKQNPRVTHDEMIKFILSDLDKAEAALAKYDLGNPNLPNLSVVYGIKAKTYLWDEQYDKAAEYAQKAIDQSGKRPMTEDEWTNPTTGFAQAAGSWMWYLHYSPEMMGNLCNFTGWMSGEADWGYSSLTFPSIDRSLYDRIGETDFRKNVFLNPDKFDYYNYQTVRDRQYIEDAPAYLALKFRCLSGDWETYSVGGAIDVPVMRVEEMYLIKALAVGKTQGVAAGAALLNSFVSTYRDPAYNFVSSNERSFELEVMWQMRIEFWGEGEGFPIAKKLKPGVMQNYAGTNAPSNIFKVNFEGIKPNWNFVIPQYEIDSNPTLDETNNPDPSETFTAPAEEGVYFPGNN